MTKTIISTAVVFAFGAFLVFAFVANNLGAPSGTPAPTPTPTGGLPDVPVSNPYEGIISFKHSFVPIVRGAGVHTYRGIMQLPTPCHRFETNAAVAESFPEQIQIYFTIVEHDDICIQRIDARPFEVVVTASRDARIGLVMVNGEPMQFSVQEEAVRVSNPSGATIAFGEPFTLAFDKEKRRDDLSVRFMGVRADSRCPENADCVWAGEAVLEFEVWNPSAPEDVVEMLLLNFPGEESQTVPGAKSYALFNGYGIHLVGVSPANVAGRTIEKEAYRATLVVNPAD